MFGVMRDQFANASKPASSLVIAEMISAGVAVKSEALNSKDSATHTTTSKEHSCEMNMAFRITLPIIPDRITGI
jgi:hypothetical protein